MRRYLLARALFPLLLAGASGHAFAQTADPAAGTAQPTSSDSTAAPAPAATEESQTQQAAAADDETKWQFSTIGYAWLSGVHGKTDVIGPVKPVDLDMTFGDVLHNLKFVFMGAAEARKDRLVFVGDFMFVHLGGQDGVGIRDPDFLEVELDSRTAALTFLGGYRAVKDAPVTIDFLAGGRANFFKTSVRVEGPNRELKGSVKQTWLDPVVAMRLRAPMGEKWGFNLYGDVGGILFGSDITWQGIATVDYQINHKMSLGAGWRHWKVDYDEGDFLYNARQSGPIITFRSKL